MAYIKRFIGINTDSDDDSPLAPHIFNVPRSKFMIPSLERNNGQGNLENHVINYKIAMRLHEATKSLMCLAFPTTLNGTTRDWYNNLTRGFITSFRNLAYLFCNQFDVGKKRKRDSTCFCRSPVEE